MKLLRPPRAVVFDMDGLLFDTEALYREAMVATALKLGVEMSDATFLRMIGLPADTSRLVLLEDYGPDFDVERFWMESAALFRIAGHGRQYLKSGALELLDCLDELALPKAIATSSGHASVERHLRDHCLTGRFQHIIASGDYARGKPQPDPYLKAAELLGFAPQDCLALEDSHNGVRSAASAGMMTIMVPDLLEATDEMRCLCIGLARDLHEVRALLELSPLSVIPGQAHSA